MASQSETGHARNVSHFQELISICTNCGLSYNPSNASIKIAGLTTAYNNALAALTNVNTVLIANTNAVNDRENTFEPIGKLVTKALAAANASNLPKNLIDDLKTIIRKLKGTRAKAKEAAEVGAAVKTHSVSQMSYDQRIENFEKLILLLGSQPNYAPNEADITVPSLTSMLAQLRAVNTAANNAALNLASARSVRNTVLYAEGTGIHNLAIYVKNYIKSIYGTGATEYKQAVALKFTANKG